MKFRIFSLLLALLLALSGCAPSFAPPAEDTGAALAPPPAQAPAEPEATPEPESEPEPLPEPEPEPEPVQPEYRDSWTAVLTGRTITARNWFVYDVQAQEFLSISGDKEASVFPASVTKLFSAYVALQYLHPEQVLTAGEELNLVPVDASVAELKIGDSLRVDQLIDGMMLPSGNDATFVIATAVGRLLTGDPDLTPQAAIDRFVEQMNYHAAMVGLTDTHFVSSDGWHNDGHYTSMDDLVKIGMLAWSDPVISKSATVVHSEIPMDEERALSWTNSNILLNPNWDVYCPYAVGLKTGFTTPAGNCLLSAFQVGDRKILIGVFGCPVSYDRYAETLLLFTQTFGLTVPEPIPEESTEPTE